MKIISVLKTKHLYLYLLLGLLLFPIARAFLLAEVLSLSSCLRPGDLSKELIQTHVATFIMNIVLLENSLHKVGRERLQQMLHEKLVKYYPHIHSS